MKTIYEKYTALAESFEDFIRLVTACGSANPVEQIVWMSKKQFEQHLKNEKAARTETQTELMEKLCDVSNGQPLCVCKSIADKL